MQPTSCNRLQFDASTQQELLNKAPPTEPLCVYNTSKSLLFKRLHMVVFGISCVTTLYYISCALLNKLHRRTLPNIPKKVAWLICFPTTLYYLLHIIMGYFIHPAMLPRCVPLFPNIDIDKLRANFTENPPNTQAEEQRIVKRFSVRVNGNLIDAVAVGKRENISKGRWMICSNGNAEFYELKHALTNNEMRMADQLNCICVFYNYPGVGRSEGSFFPSSLDFVACHQAIHKCIEDNFNPCCVIDWGYSIGGLVQGESRKTITMKDQHNTKHILVKYMSLSSLEQFLNISIAPLCGKLCRVLGWNYSSVESSKTLPPHHTEIIIQQGAYSVMQQGKDGSKSLSVKKMESLEELANTDGELPKQTTYAYATYDKDAKQKTFLLVSNSHCENLSDDALTYLANAINTRIEI